MPRDVVATDAEIPPERATALAAAVALLSTATTADLELMTMAERERAATTFWTWWMLVSPGAARPPRAAVIFGRRGH